jgi:hypothetical protein
MAMPTMSSGLAVLLPGLSNNHVSPRRPRGSARGRWVGLALTLVIGSLPAAARAEQPLDKGASAEEERRVRRTLLMEHLKEPARMASPDRYLGAIVGTVYLGLGVGLAVADFNEEESSRQKWLSVGIAGGLAGLAFSSYLVPDHARRPVLASLAPLSIAGLGAVFYGSDDASAATRFTFGSMMVTGGVMEGLVLLDAALRRPPSGLRLERHLERLRRSGASLSNQDLREIEGELALTERPIPLWVSPLVLTGGAIAAAAPALAESTSSDDRAVCLVFSSGMLVGASSALVSALMSERGGYRGYREGLRGMGLAPVGPRGSAGVTLVGSF